MQNLTVLEKKAKQQSWNAVWAAHARGIAYSPWSPIDFTGWDAFAY